MIEFGVALGLVLLIYTLWELYNREMKFGKKMLWAIVMVFFVPLGSMLYFLIVIHPVFHNHDRKM
jgi:hypothetical protein